MHLTKLVLQNFGRHASYEKTYAPKTDITEGMNATGKSTVADALLWLMTGKKKDGSGDIANYKPRHDTALVVIAEATFTTRWTGDEPNRPATITFRKEFSEDWKTTRETAEQVMNGHLIKYYINTVPMKAQQYEEEIIRYFALPSYDFAAVMMNPKQFAENIDAMKRLEMVKAAVGEPLPAEVFAAEPTAAIVAEDLKAAGWNNDALRKKLLADGNIKKKTLMDALAVSKSKVITQPITDEEYATAQKTANEAPNLEAELLMRKKSITANPKIAELESNLRTSRANDSDHRAEINNAVSDKINDKQNELDGIRDKKRNAVNERVQADNDLAVKRRLYDEAIAERDAKRKAYQAAQSRAYVPESKCPHCGVPYDEHRLADDRRIWNVLKAEEMQTIAADGIAIKTAIEAYTKEIPALEEQVKTAKAAVVENENAIHKAEGEIAELRKGTLYTYESEATAAIRTQLEAERTKPLPTTEDIDLQIDRIRKQAEGARRIVNVWLSNFQTASDKKGIDESADKLRTEVAAIESKQAALVIYEKTFRDLMEQRAKRIFPTTRIRFTKPNNNGTYDRDCTFLNEKGVTYEGTNTAEKYEVGVRVIEDWRRFYGIAALPIVLDDYEHMDADHQDCGATVQTIVFKVKQGEEARA